MPASEWQVVWFTARVAALSTLLILPPGILLAWAFATWRWPGKALCETIVALPLALPPVAVGLVLLELLGRRGFVGGFLHDALGVDIVFTWKAVVAATATMSFPLLVRSARIGFEQIERDHLDAARVEGASALQVFRHVALPLAARGIAAGTVLAFARALGEFGATILVAGNIPGRTTTLSVAIYHYVQLGRDGDAFRLLAVSSALAFAAVWASDRFLRGLDSRGRPRNAGSAGRRQGFVDSPPVD